MKRIMAMDYGTRRIGLALSDPLGITARGLETVANSLTDPEPAVRRILDLTVQYAVSELVVGIPKRTDGRPSESETKMREFTTRLEAAAKERNCVLSLVFRDERFTTKIAHQWLNQSNCKGAKSKRDVVDQVAAEVILRDYLESVR